MESNEKLICVSVVDEGSFDHASCNVCHERHGKIVIVELDRSSIRLCIKCTSSLSDLLIGVL